MAEPETHVRIAAGGWNWLTIASQLLIGLEGSGYPDPDADHAWDRDISRVEVIAPATNRAALSTVEMVGRNEAEIAITTPTAITKLAQKGRGPFSEQYDISTIGVLPHEDWLGFAVRADSDIYSIADIRDQRMGIDLSRTLPHYPPYRNVTGYLVDEVLKQYQISDEKIERWGGSVDYGGRKNIEGLINGEYDALFDEAMMTPSWNEITHNVDLRFLPVDEEVLEFLSDSYGLGRKVLPEGYLPGVDQDIPTVDMSGWVIIIRDDVEDHIAYHAARALDDQKEVINQRFRELMDEDRYTKPPMTSDIDMTQVRKKVETPLHPGAERYYESQGYD